MASLDQLETALRNADAAGDVEAARTLAAAIKQGMPEQQAPYTGTVLPISKDVNGNVHFDSNAGILGSIKRAITLPGDVYSGRQQVYQGSVSDDPARPDFVENSGSSGRVLAPEVASRSAELAAVASPVSPVSRMGGSGVAMVKVKPPVPSAEALKAAGTADINAAKNSGLEVTASSVGELSRAIQSSLFDKGIHPVDAPNTFAKLKELENAHPGAFASASNLQSLRESFGHTAQNFNPNAAKDQLAASTAIRGLDEFLPNVSAADTVAGTPAATAELFERGRGNYGAAMRSNDLAGTLDRANTGILERAENRAQAANSGRNLDNTIRSKVASVLEKPKEISGFSDAELNALDSVVQGGPARNTARYIGNLLGGGGGIGQSGIAALGAGGGAAVGGVPGAILGVVAPAITGSGAKMIANILAKRSLNKADELVRMRSPLYREALQAAESIPANLSKKEAIAKLLLMQRLNSAQQ